MGCSKMIFNEMVSNLYGLSGEEIVKRMENFYDDNSDAEKNSWRVSLPKLIEVVQQAGLGNLYLATEYELPAGGRIDATLIGDDEYGNHHLLVIELKQWSKHGVEYYPNHGFPVIKVNAKKPYLSRHPVNQTKEYTDALNGNHSNVVNGQLKIFGCQYLHKFELSKKDFFIQDAYSDVDISNMFVMGEEGKFADYLKSIFSPMVDNEVAKNLFIDGDYVTTEMDMEIISKITESPDNIPLWHDQSKILDYIMPLLKQQANRSLTTKHMILIEGAAGTGKTIVGFRILAEYWRLHSNSDNNYSCKYTLPQSRTIKQVLDGLSSNEKGIRATFLDSIKEDNLIEIVDYLRTYDYLYFVQTGVINSVGPFIKKSHLLEYNLKEILFNTDIETVFTESALLNINSFREELIAGMIIERISNYLLSLSPLHNRKLILNKDSNVVLSEELPLV